MKNRFRVLLLSFFFVIHTCALEGQSNIDVFARVFYWYTSETMDWAYVHTGDLTSSRSDYQTFVFDWAPGFSVGLGYNRHCDWDTQLSYTWFQARASDQAGGPITPGFLAARLSLLEPFSTGRANMHLHYHMFDWDIGRKWSLTPSLSIRPSIGLKGGWIDQTIHSYWTLSPLPGFLATENLKQEFRGGGGKGGLSGQWCFGRTSQGSLSLLGTFELGYLWGHWSIHDTFEDSFDTVIHLKTSPRNYGSLVLRSFVGLGWDSYMRCTHVAVKLGYEIEDWLNQSQFFTNISGSQNNDLVLQGFSLSFLLSF